MTNGYKEESYPLPADNSWSSVYSGNGFLLLPVTDGGLYGVFFDARHIYEPLDDSVNVAFLLFEGLLLKTPRLRGIVNTSEIVSCRLDVHKIIFVFNETNKYKYF